MHDCSAAFRHQIQLLQQLVTKFKASWNCQIQQEHPCARINSSPTEASQADTQPAAHKKPQATPGLQQQQGRGDGSLCQTNSQPLCHHSSQCRNTSSLGAPLPLEHLFPGCFGAQWPQPRASPWGHATEMELPGLGLALDKKTGGKKPRLPNCTIPATFLFSPSYIHQFYSFSGKPQAWQDASPCSSDIQMLCQLDGQPATPPDIIQSTFYVQM